MSDSFFDSPQGAAVLKHKLLEIYLSVFAGKLGSSAEGGRVVFIDGFAGPGQYLDDSPASPRLAVETAMRLAEVRQLECRFIEADATNYEALCQLLASTEEYEGWDAVQGNAEEHLGRLVHEAGDAPLLVFLDPYGLTVPFDRLVEIVLNRPTPAGAHIARPTEVIFNFSISAVRRFAGWLDKTYTAERTQLQQASILAKLDDFFGGDWWRDIRRAEDIDWVEKILRQYLNRLRQASTNEWGYYAADVSDRYGGPPSYYLVLMSQHADGLWYFNEGASLGLDALRAAELAGQQELDPNQRKRELADAIAQNIRMTLGHRGAFTLNQAASDVYGEVLGEARSMHVRAALYTLHKASEIADTPKGVKDLGRYRARPATTDA